VANTIDVAVEGNSTCMWLSLSFKLLLDFVLLVVFPLFFRVGDPLFHAC
jgi:hypothetical protein